MLDREAFSELRQKALDSGHKKDLLRCYEYALLHRHEPTLASLREIDYKPTRQAEDKALKQLYRNHFMIYDLSSASAVLKDTGRYGIDHRTVFNWTPLMVAARAGNVSLIGELIDRGADRSLIANHGLNTAQQVLEYATVDIAYARRMAPAWQALVPEQVSVQVLGKLVKLHTGLMALFLLNLCVAHFHRSLGKIAGSNEAFSANFLADLVADLPEQMLPAKRKRQQYISGVLSGNEIERDAPYNRRLFKRISRGQYIINPNLKLRLQDRWVGIHELLPLADLGTGPTPVNHSIPIHSEAQRELRARVEEEWHWRRERLLEKFCKKVEALIDEPVAAGEAATAGTQADALMATVKVATGSRNNA